MLGEKTIPRLSSSALVGNQIPTSVSLGIFLSSNLPEIVMVAIQKPQSKKIKTVNSADAERHRHPAEAKAHRMRKD